MKKIIRNIYRRRKVLIRIIKANGYVAFSTETECLEDGYINSNIINKDVKKACDLMKEQMDYNDSTDALNYVKEMLEQRS